jgi:hypothetical protein
MTNAADGFAYLLGQAHAAADLGSGATMAFWGPCCWELASVLRDTKERFDSTGVKLIVGGVGSSAKARILANQLRLPRLLRCIHVLLSIGLVASRILRGGECHGLGRSRPSRC